MLEIKPNWKSELWALKHAHLKATHPEAYAASGGKDYLIKPYKDTTSNGLTNCIYDFLRFKGHYCNRVNSTGLMRKIKGEMKWTKGNTNKGSADLFSIIFSKAVSVEIKIGSDKMSEAQHKEKQKVEDAGGYYIIAKDFPSFREWYKTTFENE